MEEAAKTGNVEVFIEGMRPWASKPERERKIMELTNRFFEQRTPNLFGASDSEDLKVAYQEAVACYEGKTTDERAMASAPAYVHELADIARVNSREPECAATDVYRTAYELRCGVRGFYH